MSLTELPADLIFLLCSNLLPVKEYDEPWIKDTIRNIKELAVLMLTKTSKTLRETIKNFYLSQRYPIDITTISIKRVCFSLEASRLGYTNIMIWALESGDVYIQVIDICINLVKNGDLKALSFLKKTGYKMITDKEILKQAKKYKQFHVVRWITESCNKSIAT